MKLASKKITALVVGAVLLVWVDQWTKGALGWLKEGNWQWGPVTLVWHENPGIAFSIPLPFSISLWLIIGLLLWLVWLFFRAQGSIWYELGLLLVISGGVSNLWDKFSLGFVRDFIALGSLSVLNLADLFIGLGAIAIILGAGYGTHQKI